MGDSGPQLVVTGAANTDDATNGGASFVGSSACKNCHRDVAAIFEAHAHGHALTETLGRSPEFPLAATRAVIPDPPVGFEWTDVPWVIGGYLKFANFVDTAGFLLDDSDAPAGSIWRLAFAQHGNEPTFGTFVADGDGAVDFDCFRCHTTGAMSGDEGESTFEEGRGGAMGRWSEPGVTCEACHGPGSEHFSVTDDELRINKSVIHLDAQGKTSCNLCHSRPYGSSDGPIVASDGFIANQQQSTELKASGGHSGFSCMVCHDPHRSVAYDRDNAIRNNCVVCHTDQNMALHEGKVFRRADGYEEELRCESCHMPYATKGGSAELFGLGRVGDVRTHIFRISIEPHDYQGFISADGFVVRDEAGRAAVSVDFVCLRCHNDASGGLFPLRVDRAAEIGQNVHHGDLFP